ncbi:MAG TPA: acyl carrier protein [bacterium]|jgi:acyl carrier protein|nr:acyl carrier protein [bacterium]
MKTRDEIRHAVESELHENFGIKRELLRPDADLYTDLDIDSIDAIDLMVKMQKLIGRRIQPEAFKAVRTLDDVVSVIDGLVNGPEH